MSEGIRRWTSISPRMFGMYREQDRVRHQQNGVISCKLGLALAVITAFAFLAVLVTLKLASSGPESTDRIFNSPSLRSNYTPISEEETIITSQDELIPSGEEDPLDEVNFGRRARAFEERARIVNQPIFPDQDGSAFSPMAAFSDGYPQLEGYRPPVRGFSDLMTWVDRDHLQQHLTSSKPTSVKFSGVYFKAEESRPYLNGHAYVSDPFVKFKPSHPAEINQLAVEPERSNRFSNRPTDSSTGSSHTQAVFHPYTPLRPRPLKLMLDIYPMQPEPTSSGGVEGDPRVRRPRLTPTPSGRMIVHLNLYPKKNARISRRRPGKNEQGARQRIFDEDGEGTAMTQLTTESLYEETTLPTTNPPFSIARNV